MKKTFRPKSSSPSKPAGRSADARPFRGKPAKNQGKPSDRRSPDRESRSFGTDARPKRTFSSKGKPGGSSGYSVSVEPLDVARERKPARGQDKRPQRGFGATAAYEERKFRGKATRGGDKPIRGGDKRREGYTFDSRSDSRAQDRDERSFDDQKRPQRSFATKSNFTRDKFAKDNKFGKDKFGKDKPAFGFSKRDDSEKRPSRVRTPKNHAQRETGRPHEKAARVYGKPAAKPFVAREIAPSNYVAAGNNVLLWGLHAVRAAWLNPKRRIHRVWLTESGKASLDKSITEGKEALLKRPDAKMCERFELDRLTPPGSVHQGIVIETEALIEPALHDLINSDNPPDVIIMLDQVTDPHNVGAILRSASAFGAGAVILTERNAPSMTGVLAKSASGAVEHTPQIHVVNLARALDELQEAGYWRCGLAEEGTKDLSEMDLSGRTVLVMGNEGEGLRQLTRKKCDELARLPTGGAIGSLNVSNAAAVALYEVRRQKKKF